MVMRYLLPIAIALLAAACDFTEPTPVWMPGQPPLAIWAATDQLWAAVDAGCARWRAAELRCRRVADRDNAQLEVEIEDIDAAGKADYRYSSTGWVWAISIDPNTMITPNAADVAAHELGHTLGIIDHLPPGNLMAANVGQPTPTTADYDALAAAWGEAPWLE
jgi:hypothetical protein